MSDIEALFLITGGLFFLLLFRHIRLKKQIRSLTEQVNELSEKRTEKMLDISLIDQDLEQLAGTLNRYNERQRQAVASSLGHEEYLKESIANISHDLRTPLTVILGHMQLLKKENLEDGQAQRVEIVLGKAERMKELLENFYDLSVLDAEQIVLHMETFNLSNLLINLITENAPALETKNLSPQVDLPDYSIYINSDKGTVERMIQNLLTNAIRYSSGIIRITLFQKENGKVVFRIENSVHNFSELNPNRLFERFYTGDKSRHNGGTGLGLNIVKILTDKLGGTVYADLKADILSITLEL